MARKDSFPQTSSKKFQVYRQIIYHVGCLSWENYLNYLIEVGEDFLDIMIQAFWNSVGISWTGEDSYWNELVDILLSDDELEDFHYLPLSLQNGAQRSADKRNEFNGDGTEATDS